MRIRSPELAIAVAFGCSACLLLVDTTGLTGGAAPDASMEGAAPFVDGGDAGIIDAAADADATIDAGSYRDLVMKDSPALYLRLGETSGTVAADELGLHNGAIASDVIKGQASLVRGETNGAMAFTNSAYILVPPFDGILAGTKPYSIEAWILVPTSISSAMWILGRDDVNPPRYGNSFIVTNTEVAIERWIAGDARRAMNTTLRFGEPTHVVSTYDGVSLQVWVNGQSIGASAAVATPVNDIGASIAIGSQSQHFNGFFRGTIDEVAIYEHVLPAASITAHYERGKP